MNIAKANTIPLPEILKKIGLDPSINKQNDLWYHSPFREERTPSFHVNLAKNVWFDHGEDLGGTVLGFVCTYLKQNNYPYTAKDALRWLSEHAPDVKPLPKTHKPIIPPILAFNLQRISPLHTKYLTDYIKERGIDIEIAKRYLKEIDFSHSATKRTFKAVGLRNVADGFELRNRAFKGSVVSKNIALIRGSESPGDIVHVFESMFDYLSALLYQEKKRFKDDCIILNSVSNLKKAFPYIKDYTYEEISTWLDNDRAGSKATEEIKEFALSIGLKHQRKNQIYAPYKDVNAWHVANHQP